MELRLVEVLVIAVGMAMDAFAVSLGAGTTGKVSDRRSRLRLAFHLGLFQSLMPILGWALGIAILPLISAVDHWIAFGLLGFVGVRMIRSGLDKDGDFELGNPARGLTMVMLCVATSIDALAIGLTFAILNVKIWTPVLAIGVVTAALSLLGLGIGRRLGVRFGKRMEVVGGLVLLYIGIRIVFSHMSG